MAKQDQLNSREQKVSQEQIPKKGNRPGGELPEWSLWKPKVVRGKNGQQRETSVKSPDGKTYEIKEDEQFVVEKGENGDYEAAIVSADGEKIILRESLVSKEKKHEQQDKEESDRLRESLGLEKENSQETTQEKQEEEPPYDRERLNEIAKKCAEKGALFGKDVNLDDEDKKQIEIVTKLVDEQINEAVKDDEEWKNFEKLQSKLVKEGIMLVSACYVDGGENAQVHERRGDKTKKEAPVQIVVPSRVYNAHYYKNVAQETINLYVKPSNEAMRGQSVKGLRENLGRLKHFIKATRENKN